MAIPDSYPQPWAYPPATLSSELKGWGWRLPWLSLPRPCPKGSGHPRSQQGRSNFLKADRGRDRDRKPGDRAQLGRAEDPRAPGGPGNPAGVKYHLPSDRHTLQDSRGLPVGGQHTHPEKRTQATSTQQCVQRHSQRTHRTEKWSHTPSTDVHHVQAHLTGRGCLALPSCVCSLPVI